MYKMEPCGSHFTVAPPQQRLYFLPEPHEYGSFRATLEVLCRGFGAKSRACVGPSRCALKYLVRPQDSGRHVLHYFFPPFRSKLAPVSDNRFSAVMAQVEGPVLARRHTKAVATALLRAQGSAGFGIKRLAR